VYSGNDICNDFFVILKHITVSDAQRVVNLCN